MKKYTKELADSPDGLKGRTLKNCSSARKLFHSNYHYNYSWTDSYVMPRAWKTSTIIPVPKKATPLQLNEYRPVALTKVQSCCRKSSSPTLQKSTIKFPPNNNRKQGA